MTDALHETDDLPFWFRRPQPERVIQPYLFTAPLSEVLASLRVSADDLTRWHERDWVSFDAAREESLEPCDVNEIRFVREVVRSGLSDAQIECLFKQLPRPMNFDTASLAYSFEFGWVVACATPEPAPFDVVDENVESWLDMLAKSGENDRLFELRCQLDELLVSVPKSPEAEEDVE